MRDKTNQDEPSQDMATQFEPLAALHDTVQSRTQRVAATQVYTAPAKAAQNVSKHSPSPDQTCRDMPIPTISQQT